MKLALTTLAAIFAATSASAFTFPAHQQDGFRDTGCQVVPAYTAGQTYHADPSCPQGSGATFVAAEPEAPVDPVDETPVDEPELPTCRVTGC